MSDLAVESEVDGVALLVAALLWLMSVQAQRDLLRIRKILLQILSLT